MGDCTSCSHPFAWHGDRAVAACLGLQNPSTSSFLMKLALCPCAGWTQKSPGD